MLPTLTIFLFVAILAIFTLICLTCLSVAFAGPDPAMARVAKQSWQPPSSHENTGSNENTLVDWAARMAASVTRQRMSKTRCKATATELATELYAGTSEVIEQLREEEAHCSARCHEMIGVMAPEVLAVAADIRSHMSEEETESVRHKANADATKTNAMSRDEYAAANVTCPLLGDDGSCSAYSFRPLFCRTDCATCGSDEHCESDDLAGQRRPASSTALARGIGRGISTSLTSAGVDANRYELSSALVVALDAPDVSERWAKGEPVFAGCRRFDV
jgi:Fe-S-cluster containining protein